MTLGALIDLGLPVEELQACSRPWGWPRSPHGPPGDQRAPHRHQGGDRGRGAQPARTYRDIRALIEAAPLTEAVKARSLTVFRLLGEVEARIHGQALETVHFHELGGLDTIVDLVGVAFGWSAWASPGSFAAPCPWAGA